jgi:excisionase family DNA binding protein
MTAQPRPASQPAEHLTIAKAAARYRVSRDYIRHRIVDGSLPAVRSGRRIIRINSSDLEHHIPSRPVDAVDGSCHGPRVSATSAPEWR